MLDVQFFGNPDFMEYVRLLYDLQVALREGRDETADGEALRERMDEPGGRVSGEEIASLNGISADFYSLTDEPPADVSPITAEVMADLEAALEARKSKDFNKALELLRIYARHIPPASLAYLRGRVWLEAGEHPIAAAFLQRASELDPDNANYRYLALHSLWMSSPSTAIDEAQAILSNSENNPPRLVLKAADILSHQTRTRPPDQTREELKSLIPILQNSIFRLETSGEAEIDPNLLGKASGLIDYCYEHIVQMMS